MWERYSEPLSLADIAESAVLSRFHFSRIFKEVTGVPPGKFLSAVRIHQAKRMLLTTSKSVAEISAAVGYSSLGSFTSHFTDSVGFSPSRFRRMSDHGTIEPVTPLRMSSLPEGEIVGMIRMPEGYAAALVYIGVFDTRIVQHRPRAVTLVEMSSARPHPYRLAKVPEGQWFVHAVAVADSAEPEPWNQRSLLVGGHGPLRVASGTPTLVTVALRPRQSADLPILLAIPDLDSERESLMLPEPGRYQRIRRVGN